LDLNSQLTRLAQHVFRRAEHFGRYPASVVYRSGNPGINLQLKY
jgi:hypothetical protein